MKVTAAIRGNNDPRIEPLRLFRRAAVGETIDASERAARYVEWRCVMQWDLGPTGLGLLIVMSVAFGVVAHVIAGRVTTSWVGLIAAAAYFVVGVLISEVWFGWATEAELQPNIDGLSFDEVLLGYVVGIPIVLAVLYFTRRSRQDTPSSA